MPKFTTPAGTTQRYIAALDRNAPDSVPGTKKVYADRAAFLQGVADERASIAMGLPVWYDGIDLQVMSEPLGAKRLWSLATSAGSASANAAASHGRTAVIGAFVKVLSNDSSRIHSTTGVPASGLGDNGDMAWDQVAGIVYEKASGAWSILVSMYGSGGSSPVAPGAVQNLAAGTATTNSQPLSWQAPATGTGPFTYQVAYRLGTSTGAYTNFGSPVSGLSATVTGLSAGTAYDYQVTAISAVGTGPAATINDVSTAAGATVPGAPDAPTATAGDGTVSLAFVAPSTGGSPILEYGALLSNGNTNTGSPTGSPVSVASANGAPVTGQIRARNAIGWGPWSDPSNSVTPQAAAAVPQTIVAGNIGQWVEELIKINTRARDTAGSYVLMGSAGNAGQVNASKIYDNGTVETVLLATHEPDDHNEPNPLQFPDGTIAWFYNRHAVSGQSGFRYRKNTVAHAIALATMGPVVTVPSTDDPGNGIAPSYTQFYMPASRIIGYWRAGGSQGAGWIQRHSDDTMATWSAGRILMNLAYLDTAVIGDTMHMLMCNHPGAQDVDHHMWEMSMHIPTGVLSANGAPIVIGGVEQNAYSTATGQVPIPTSSMRLAVSVPHAGNTQTSRLFGYDGTQAWGMEMGFAQTQAGTYYRYVRNGDTGLFTKSAVGSSGLPFVTNSQGAYYDGWCVGDGTYGIRAVNKGASIGVGDHALELFLLSDGSLVRELYRSPNVLCRPMFRYGFVWFGECSAYASYESFTGNVRRLSVPEISWTAEPSLPIGTNPAPSGGPVFATQPSLTPATPQVGKMVRVSVGTTDNATGYAWTLKQGGATVASGTATTPNVYVPTVNGALTLEVTASNGAGSTAATPVVTSALTAADGTGYADITPLGLNLAVVNAGNAYSGTPAATNKLGKVLLAHALPVSTDGELIAQFLGSAGDNGGALSFDPSSTLTMLYGDSDFGVGWTGAGGLSYILAGVETTISGVTLTDGTYVRLRRASGTVTIETSTDLTNWTVRYTYSGTSTARLVGRIYTTYAGSAPLVRYNRNPRQSGGWIKDVVAA